jgi:TolB-like protein/Tfp pilus assembly protein PilF
VWWDRRMEGGAAFAKVIEAELNAARSVIVAWSEAARESDWVKDEAATARDQGKLVPISVDGTAAPLGFRQYHVIDLASWGGGADAPAFRDLLRAIEARSRGEAAPGVGTEQVPPAGTGAPRRRAKPPMRVIIPLVLVLLAVTAALLLRSQRRDERAIERPMAGAATAAESPAGNSAIASKSIAVLPFANRSPRPDDAYFAEGVHDDLLTQLSKMRDVRVISRTSVMRYADTNEPIPQIARELGVGVVLEGGVQRAGDRVRINVQLIDGRTDNHLWSETYDRELTVENLLDIQSDITRAIAAALQSVLSGHEADLREALPTRSTEAYNAYLLGNTLNRYELRNPEKMKEAVRAYDRAVTLDPGFAAAHARKAIAQLTLAWWGIDSAANIRLAEGSLERARTLAPDSSETKVAEGYYRYWARMDYAGAYASLKAILEDSPQDSRLWFLQGAVARRVGNMEASIAAFKRVFALDPQDSDAAANLAVCYAYLGEMGSARDWLNRAWALSPDSGYNTEIESIMLALMADPEAAWQRYERLRNAPGSDTVTDDAAFSYLVTWLRDPTRLETLERRLAGSHMPGDLPRLYVAYARAEALMALGRLEEARGLARDTRSRLASMEVASTEIDNAAVLGIQLDALLGDAAATRKALTDYMRNPPADQLWLVEATPGLVLAYARLGDPSAAFDLVERAMNRYSPAHFYSIATERAFDPYRNLPRYKELDARYRAWKSAQPAVPTGDHAASNPDHAQGGAS